MMHYCLDPDLAMKPSLQYHGRVTIRHNTRLEHRIFGLGPSSLHFARKQGANLYEFLRAYHGLCLLRTLAAGSSSSAVSYKI